MLSLCMNEAIMNYKIYKWCIFYEQYRCTTKAVSKTAEVIMNPVAVARILAPLFGVETSVVEVVALKMSGVLAGIRNVQ